MVEGSIGMPNAEEPYRSKTDRDRRVRLRTARHAKRYMQQATRLAEIIDELFGGEPFDYRYPPDDRRNVRRFRRYLFMQKRAFKLFSDGFELWRRAMESPLSP